MISTCLSSDPNSTRTTFFSTEIFAVSSEHFTLSAIISIPSGGVSVITASFSAISLEAVSVYVTVSPKYAFSLLTDFVSFGSGSLTVRRAFASIGSISSPVRVATLFTSPFTAVTFALNVTTVSSASSGISTMKLL